MADPFLIAKEMKEALALDLSRETIRRQLKDVGLKWLHRSHTFQRGRDRND